MAPFEGFEGTYLGFSPTDESDVGYGEIEITIKEGKIAVRHATGLGVHAEKMSMNDFEPMSAAEVAEHYEEGPYAARTVGFKQKDSEYPQFFFLQNPQDQDDEIALIVDTGGMAEMLGPTFLFNQEQVSRGVFEKTLSALEDEAGKKGIVPRLKNGGKAAAE